MPSPADESDVRHLRRAIELASAQGRTSPSPLVGAVLVKGERVISEGSTPVAVSHTEL